MHLKIFNVADETEINNYIHSNSVQQILTTSDKVIVIINDGGE